MWLYRQIKKHPYLVMSVTLLLGGVAFPILYLMAVAWAIYAITAVTCLVVGPSLGGCLGWLVDRGNRNQGSPSVSSRPPPTSRPPPIPIVVAPAQDNGTIPKLKQESKREEVKKEEKRVVAGKKQRLKTCLMCLKILL